MDNLHYDWTLKDANFAKDQGKVFSCFACGGGSTMGYKLAGFDVIGFNEIDPKMAECYIANHNPKYAYVEPIQKFKLREDLPEELYNLDILDGSPPCSSFSMAGSREKGWGKEKVFREGQARQVLDTLFFDFIDLAKKLQPKIVVAENVKGMVQGEAKSYVAKVLLEFEEAGYYVDYKLLDASTMGIPQRRERVFFYAVRKDLFTGSFVDLFMTQPRLDLKFNEKKVKYGEIESNGEDGLFKVSPSIEKMYNMVGAGEQFSKYHPKGHMFNAYKTHPDKVLPTLTSQTKQRSGGFNHNTMRSLSKSEVEKATSYPSDYNYLKQSPYYLCGMSVPPIMTARIANEINKQWLKEMI